ncbi:MAG: hypothetical protein XD93_1124 [candidate division WS6 bacterium 34_10]|uniref:Uncharacterized protein n=1 Tax=candidate division WS6 bacterium 34_10 TaxID=1641389 RepID=A0A101HG86_9BACT|nr:MAG: hypothetical protein XD93_1124 [candidate division WS6 bacterium 34_10]
MVENDQAQEVNKIIVSPDTPDITFENDQAYIQIQSFNGEEGYKEELDEFIKSSKVDPYLGKNGSLLYEESNGTKIVIPNQNSQAISFINKVIEREERDVVLSETEIIAKNKAIELEDASKNVKDWSEYQSQDMIWENNRVKFEGGKVNLNGGTILQALYEPQILGEKVRIKYSNSKDEESIYYFSLDQASRIIDISNNQNLKGTMEKIDILRNKEVPAITFNKPQIEDDLIISNKLRIPKIFLEENYQVHRAIKENNKSYTVSIYVKGSGNSYRLDFNLEDYNRLLKLTA